MKWEPPNTQTQEEEMTLLWIRDVSLMFPMSELRLAPDLSSILTITVNTLRVLSLDDISTLPITM
jgi:hypothetical protein